MRYVQRAETRDEMPAWGGRGRVGRVEADAVVARRALDRGRRPASGGVPRQTPFAGSQRLGGSPIVSIELWLDRVVVDRLMVGLRDSEVEWVFDKGRLFGRARAPRSTSSFIVSAAVRDAPAAERRAGRARAESTLRRYFPAMAGARVDALAGAARARGHVRVRRRQRRRCGRDR